MMSLHRVSYFAGWSRSFLKARKFGQTAEEQIASYFEQAEQIRKYVRNAETDNFPSLEQTVEELDKS